MNKLRRILWRSNGNERATVFPAKEDQKQCTQKKEKQSETRETEFFDLGAHKKTLVSIHLYTLLINSENYLFGLSYYLSISH